MLAISWKYANGSNRNKIRKDSIEMVQTITFNRQ